MMAEGYQESGLNYKVHSKSGAIGIMQLLPSTGQKMKVGDIHRLDANIHAGVKYIHFMVNEYFAKEPMTETNKLLFSFAAYNAGPGRIKALRREAAQEELDPNVWSDNVEMIAEARIGRETVTYVDNIYKYYVAYKLIEEHNQQKGKTLVQMKPNS
jgi:membrane-bound lytic murein transglycosylase MltF